MVQLTIRAQATFRFFRDPGEPELATLNVSTTFMVRLFPADCADDRSEPVRRRRSSRREMPVGVRVHGIGDQPAGADRRSCSTRSRAASSRTPSNVSGNWSQFRIMLPLPPTTPGNDHTLTIRAIDTFGTTGEISMPFAVQPQPPIVVPPGAKTTFSGAPTTSSITSWTRLEPQCTDADMGTSSSARVFDPLWMLTRQWQMGEFQAEDAGTPIQARVRATSATLRRRFSASCRSRPAPARPPVAAQPYDPVAHAAGGARRAPAACAPPTRATPAC